MARFNRGFYLKFKCETFGGEEVTLQVNTTKQAHYHDVLDKEELNGASTRTRYDQRMERNTSSL